MEETLESAPRRGLRIAVEGCCHGELDKIYDTMRLLEERDGRPIDLLLCCGDFQAVRNLDDLECMACPPKYRHLATFYKYYSGEKVAPYPTIFVGGNHEASNHLWELHLGGWVAPNIYYLGAAGAVRFGGLRIAGLSGIFKSGHFGMGHFERPPYTDSTMRSAYHVRATDVNRLLRLEGPTDVFLSHDWPAGVARHGDAPALFRKKPFLRREVEDGSLGSPPAAQVLAALRPAYWFAAHLHTKFAALVPHPGAAPTRFLSLDKCLPGRSFLQVVDFPEAQGPRQVEYDAEWLAVLRATHGLTCLRQRAPPPPPPQPPTEAEVEAVRRLLAARGGPAVPPNFVQTAPPHDAAGGAHQRGRMPRGGARNPQTVALLEMLGLPYNLDPQGEAAAASGAGRGTAGPAEPNPEEIDIGDDEPMDAEDAVNPEEIDLDGSEGEPDAVDPALAAILAGAS